MRRAQRDTAQANVAQAQANTQIAAINYSYTRVLAPFDGRVSAHLVSVGDLVGTQPTKLATIVQIKPIYVTFNVSEQVVIRIRGDALREGRRVESIQTIPVEIGLQGETGYPHRGHMDYVAPTVDPSTGTLMARGVLENADGVLLPGYFARVRVPLETGVEALLVPDAALGGDQGGRYLLVVGAGSRRRTEACNHGTAGRDVAGDRDRVSPRMTLWSSMGCSAPCLVKPSNPPRST